MFAPIVLAALLGASPLGDAPPPSPSRSTVTVGGLCSNDCTHGKLVLGAGEIVGRRGDGSLIVLTARHVVDKIDRPLVYLRDGDEPGSRFSDLWQSRRGRPGNVLALSPDADLALVTFRPRYADTYAIATLSDESRPSDGEILGDPNGVLWTTSPFRFLEAAADTFVVDCVTCGPGDSGGGAFDYRGRLTGILIRQRVDPRKVVDGEAAGTTQFQVVALSKVRSFIVAATRDADPPRAIAARRSLSVDDPWARFDAMRRNAAIR